MKFENDLECIKYHLKKDQEHIDKMRKLNNSAHLKVHLRAREQQIKSTLDLIKSIEESK